MCTRQETLERLNELIELQQNMEQEFGCSNYNVFVFGSYITNRYEAGKSDIDVAIYTPDFCLYKRLAYYLEDYFNRKGTKNDIFYIDTAIEAPVYCAALNSLVQFTDYYPKELKEFSARCHIKLMEEMK